MSRKKDSGDGERFADLVDDVVPLPDPPHTHAPEARRPAAAPPQPVASSHGRRFLRDTGEGSGRADDTARRMVAELRQGAHPPQREIDLHGLRSDAARRSFEGGLAAATEARERCVLVIHGLGKRSPDGPVLKRALPDWIEASHQAAQIAAWSPAPRGLGGDGATLILLRRSRTSRA